MSSSRNLYSGFSSVSSNGVLAKFVLLLALGTALSSASLAAPPTVASGQPVFATIDMGKVANSSKIRLQAGQELKLYQQRLTNSMKQLLQEGAYYLSPDEINELFDLYAKAKPTTADTNRITQLESKINGLRREMITLQNTAKPADAQTQRLTELNAARDAGEQAIKALNDRAGQQLLDRQQEEERRTIQQIRQVVAKIAKAKKISVIFAGKGMMYDAVDITDDVVKAVSK